MISVIVPTYNEVGNVASLHRKLVTVMREMRTPFELIFVDSASTDGTATILRTLSHMRAIFISRKTGQTDAIDAGIQAARGNLIVIIDADLQNDPEDIPRLHAKLLEGYDAVVGWRNSRHDTVGRRIFSGLANWLSRRVLGLHIHDFGCALKIFKREFIKDIRLYGEMHIFLAAILHLRGARVAEIEVRHAERAAGASKHTFMKGLKVNADLLTIRFILGTARPLLVFLTAAIIMWMVGAAAIIWAAVLKLQHLRNLAETPLPVIASLFIILGVLLVMLGFLAELILRSYYEGRRVPPYFIKETLER